MHETAFKGISKQYRFVDAVIAAGLALGLNQNNHTLSLGLLIAWICIRCSQQLWKGRSDQDWRLKGLFSITILGLTTFQARTIIQLDDHPGGTLYILIAACLYIGSCYTKTQKKTLIRWISGAALTINAQILIAGITSNHNILIPGWMVPINNDIFELGFGRINSLASVISYFALIGFYGLRTEKSPVARCLHGLTLTTSYFLCLQSNSQMAMGAPIAAAVATFLLCRKDYFQKNRLSRHNLAKMVLATSAGIVLTWILAFKDKVPLRIQSDHFISGGEIWRLEEWRCWIQNSIFAGNNKIVHGIGYKTANVAELCRNNNPDGGLAQFISQHGLLGALSLTLLMIYLIKNILQLREQERSTTGISSLWCCHWSEATIGMVVVVLMCNLITPSYAGGYFNASLIGIIFSLGIDIAPSQVLKE